MAGKIREYDISESPSRSIQFTVPVLWLREMRSRGFRRIDLLREGDDLIFRPAKKEELAEVVK